MLGQFQPAKELAGLQVEASQVQRLLPGAGA
jgi:hypothetical protein